MLGHGRDADRRGVTAPKRPTRRQAIAFVAVASLAFAASSPLARWARPLDPLLLAFARCALAGAILLVFEGRSALAALRRMTARQRLGIACAGVLLGAHFALFQLGLDRTSLPAAVSLVALEPLAVVACAWIFLGVAPSRGERVGVLVATAGGLLVARGAGAGEHRIGGDLLVLGAVVLFGVYVVAARALRESMAPRSYAAVVYCTAGLALAPVLLLPSTEGCVRWPLPPHAAIAIVGIALVPTIVGHTLVQTAARWLPPAIVGLASPGETVGSLVLGAAFLGLVPATNELLGAAVVVAGATAAILGASPSAWRPPATSSSATGSTSQEPLPDPTISRGKSPG